MYCVDDDVVWCGCFKGTMAEFKLRVEETHENNARYLAEYQAVIVFLEAVALAYKANQQLNSENRGSLE